MIKANTNIFLLTLQVHPITILKTIPSLVISCDFNDSKPWEGEKRGIITTQQGYYKCLSCQGSYSLCCSLHIKSLVDWLEVHADEAICDVFDGYGQKSAMGRSKGSNEDLDCDTHSVSTKTIKLNFVNMAMIDHACSGESGL